MICPGRDAVIAGGLGRLEERNQGRHGKRRGDLPRDLRTHEIETKVSLGVESVNVCGKGTGMSMKLPRPMAGEDTRDTSRQKSHGPCRSLRTQSRKTCVSNTRVNAEPSRLVTQASFPGNMWIAWEMQNIAKRF